VIIFFFLFMHYMGDFVLQSHWMASNKSKRNDALERFRLKSEQGMWRRVGGGWPGVGIDSWWYSKERGIEALHWGGGCLRDQHGICSNLPHTHLCFECPSEIPTPENSIFFLLHKEPKPGEFFPENQIWVPNKFSEWEEQPGTPSQVNLTVIAGSRGIGLYAGGKTYEIKYTAYALRECDWIKFFSEKQAFHKSKDWSDVQIPSMP